MSDDVRVLHYRHTYVHRYEDTYTVTHPGEFGFVFIFEIETHKLTSFVRIRVRIRQNHFEFERATLEPIPTFQLKKGGGIFHSHHDVYFNDPVSEIRFLTCQVLVNTRRPNHSDTF